METYVAADRFRGTCYRAANWRHVGQTRGRGRQDRDRKSAVGVKEVYLYPLHAEAQALLCRASAELREEPAAPGPEQDWAEQEFGRAALGDARLCRRLVSVV